MTARKKVEENLRNSFRKPWLAEYIWIDGQAPTKKLRSKTKVLEDQPQIRGLEMFPDWSFDGSSTEQAAGGDSDRILKPVNWIVDPTRPPLGKRAGADEYPPNCLVLCEVMNPDGTAHASNTRALLRARMETIGARECIPWSGIEQEYTMYDGDGSGRPFRWPPQATAFPAPQGKYYCGVGSDEVYGRPLVEAHLRACLSAGLKISGVNAEVMPAQWEFQVGPLDPLECADQLWLARWLLYRIGEEHGISVKLDPKPIAGDWNGAGAHINFSTRQMRAAGGLRSIRAACRRLGSREALSRHIAVYGADNDKRLTGRHETCRIDQFRWGVGDRGASVRIPAPVAAASRGYLEDRRPAANVDPYEALTALVKTICR